MLNQLAKARAALRTVLLWLLARFGVAGGDTSASASDSLCHPVPAPAKPERAPTRSRPIKSAWATERFSDGRFAEALKPPLSPGEAAQQFVGWLRQVHETGDYAARGLLTRYAEFCEVEKRMPVPGNMILAALKAVPGVYKLQAKGTTKDGKRHRPTRWVIGPADPSTMGLTLEAECSAAERETSNGGAPYRARACDAPRVVSIEGFARRSRQPQASEAHQSSHPAAGQTPPAAAPEPRPRRAP